MKKIIIQGFGETICEKIKKDKRKPPEVQQITRYRKYGKDGTALEIINFFALKIIIDDTEVKEVDFSKLFPSMYETFNIELSRKLKTVAEKTKIDNKAYFYFPNEMLHEHMVKVIYRDNKNKMNQIIYDLTKSNENE